MGRQSAKFFCENCGAEVPQNARVCRHCGKFFSSVRCPACGTTGSPGKFADGCPNCGYAVGQGRRVDAPPRHEAKATRKSKKALLSAIDSRNPKGSRRLKKSADGTLPVWSYFIILAILALSVLCAMRYLGSA